MSVGELLGEPEQWDRRDRLHQYDAIQDQIGKAEDAAKMRGHWKITMMFQSTALIA